MNKMVNFMFKGERTNCCKLTRKKPRIISHDNDIPERIGLHDAEDLWAYQKERT